ncbi:hypothetical protein ABBQ32_005334 [Trebouxia sp. C0010 RCD-2024]
MCSVCTGYNVTATALNTYLNAHVSNAPTIITNAELHTSYNLTDIKCANMISLGVLQGAWGWAVQCLSATQQQYQCSPGIMQPALSQHHYGSPQPNHSETVIYARHLMTPSSTNWCQAKSICGIEKAAVP